MDDVAQQKEIPACNNETALLHWTFWRAVPITIQGEVCCVGYNEWKEDAYVEDENLIIYKDIIWLLAVESTSKEQERDYEHNGR